MKSYVYTAIWGVAVWLFAILFFVFAGEYVLHPPGTKLFVISTLSLLAGTGVLLWVVCKVYAWFDSSERSVLKFGILGTFIGLILDTFSLSYYAQLFPSLQESQVIAFTVWMSAAYAFFLLIPFWINHRQKTRR